MDGLRIAAALTGFALFGASFLVGGQQQPPVASSPAGEAQTTELEWLLDVGEAEERSRASGRPMMLLVRCPP